MAMKQKIRHVHARNDEWVRVHRGNGRGTTGGCGSVGGDWGWMKVAGGVVLAMVAIAVLSALMPYIVGGLMIWGALSVFLKSK